MVLAVAAAVMVMHALSSPGTSHHSPFGAMSSMAPTAQARPGAAPTNGHDHAPAGGSSTPEPAGHLLSMTICAFAVLVGARVTGRVGGPRRRAVLPAPEPTIRPVTGPEPPVPRPAA